MLFFFFTLAGFDTDVNATVNKSTCRMCLLSLEKEKEREEITDKWKLHVCNCPYTGLCLFFREFDCSDCKHTLLRSVCVMHPQLSLVLDVTNCQSSLSLQWSKVVVNSINNNAFSSPPFCGFSPLLLSPKCRL